MYEVNNGKEQFRNCFLNFESKDKKLSNVADYASNASHASSQANGKPNHVR